MLRPAMKQKDAEAKEDADYRNLNRENFKNFKRVLFLLDNIKSKSQKCLIFLVTSDQNYPHFDKMPKHRGSKYK